MKKVVDAGASSKEQEEEGYSIAVQLMLLGDGMITVII
jgi:hypothetical protein